MCFWWYYTAVTWSIPFTSFHFTGSTPTWLLLTHSLVRTKRCTNNTYINIMSSQYPFVVNILYVHGFLHILTSLINNLNQIGTYAVYLHIVIYFTKRGSISKTVHNKYKTRANILVYCYTRSRTYCLNFFSMFCCMDIRVGLWSSNWFGFKWEWGDLIEVYGLLS